MSVPQMTEAEALRVLAQQVERIGSQSLAARAWGVSQQLLSDVLMGKRHIGPKLGKQLGFRSKRFLIYRYEQGERPHAS